MLSHNESSSRLNKNVECVLWSLIKITLGDEDGVPTRADTGVHVPSEYHDSAVSNQ